MACLWGTNSTVESMKVWSTPPQVAMEHLRSDVMYACTILCSL